MTGEPRPKRTRRPKQGQQTTAADVPANGAPVGAPPGQLLPLDYSIENPYLGAPLAAIVGDNPFSLRYFEFAAQLVQLIDATQAGAEYAAITSDDQVYEDIIARVLVNLADRPELHDRSVAYITSEKFRKQFAKDVLTILTVVEVEKKRASTEQDDATWLANWGIPARDDLADDAARQAAYADIRKRMHESVEILQSAYVDYVVKWVPLEGEEAPPRPPMATIAQVVGEDGLLKVTTLNTARALFDAIHTAQSGTDWSDYDGQRPPTHTTQFAKGKGGSVYVSVRAPQSKAHLSGAEIAALWERLRQMDQVTSDLLIYCLAACIDQPGWVWISFKDFLKVRNIKPIQKAGEPRTWGHGYRTEQIAPVAAAIDQLALLYIEMENVLMPNKRDTLTRNSPVLVTRELWVQREMDGQQIAVMAEVQLGTWAEAYREAGVIQFGYLAKKALEYNPRTRQPEKLIAKYLLFHHRNDAKNASRGGGLHRSMLTLLTVADISRDTQRPARTEERLKQALDRLRNDGVIGGWRFVVDESPQARNRAQSWGNTMIEIDPPAAARTQYARLHRTPERPPPTAKKRGARV